MKNYELHLTDYWRIIKKKKFIVISTVILVTIFSFVFALMNKPEPIYRATASIQVEESSSLASLYRQTMNWRSGSDLATRAEVLTSYSNIEKAAQEMGLLDSTLSSAEIRANKSYFGIVSGLKSRVSTKQQGYTNIINIKVTDHNPQRAAKFANTLARVYKQTNYKKRHAKVKQALSTLKNQLDSARQRYLEIEKKLHNYKQRNQFYSVDSKTARLSKRLNERENKIESLSSDINRINNILEEAKENPQYLKYISFNLLLNRRNNMLSVYQKRLNDYYSQLNSYSNYLTEDNPRVQRIKGKIDQVNENIIQELKSFKRGLTRLRKEHKRKKKTISQQYHSLPQKGVMVSSLQRKLEDAQKYFQDTKTRYQEAQIKKSELGAEIFLVKPAFVPDNPINSSRVVPITMVGFIIGIILGVVLAFVAEILDTTFRTVDDIEESLDTTVTGVIPFIDRDEVKEHIFEESGDVDEDLLNLQSKLIALYSPKSTIAEAFRTLRTNVNFIMEKNDYSTLLVSSSISGEGKTTVAVNLALSMSQIGLNTLLVESDLRRPKISEMFGIDKGEGITDCILKRDSAEKYIKNINDLLMGRLSKSAIKQDISGLEYLNILTAGKHIENPSEIIADKNFSHMIEELENNYDIVIFDSAPIIQATDSSILSTKVDATMLVYYQGKISRNTLKRTSEQVERLDANIIGVTVNGMKSDVSADYSSYQYSYEYIYSYGNQDLEPKNKIVKTLSDFYLRPSQGLMLSFFQRLYKLRAIGTIFVIGALIAALYFGPQLVDNISGKQKPDKNNKRKVEQKAQKNSQQKNTAQPISHSDTSSQIDNNQSITFQQRNIKSDSEKKSSIRRIGSPEPYSIVLSISDDLKTARNKVRSLRDKGLPVYLTPDYSDSDNTLYSLRYGNFVSKKEARKRAKELLFLDIINEVQINYAPYALLFSKSESYKEQKLPGLYHYYKEIKNQETGKEEEYILLGSFASKKYANLFKLSHDRFQNYKLIKR